MRFDPHLEELARQLEADAALLADKYPPRPLASDVLQAGEGHPAVGVARRRPAVWFARTAAASVVLALGAWGTLHWLGNSPHGRAHGPTAEKADKLPAIRPADIARTSQAAAPASTLRSGPANPVDERRPWSVPVLLFHDLTSPEQEAVLDLMEAHGMKVPDLSI
jgi:hypothetical protein